MTDSIIEVTGSGAVEVPCDRVRVNVGSQAAAESVADAFTEAEKALRRMVETLREHGAEQLQSSQVEVHSDYERRSPRRFVAAMRVRVSLPGISSAGAVLAAAIEAGGDASRVYGLTLTSSSTREALAAARQAAWVDAQARAEQYAQLAGRRLGAVMGISERNGRDDVDYEATPAVALSASAAPSLEAGSQAVRATVTVRWVLTDEP